MIPYSIDSLVYLTKPGAIKVLQNYNKLLFAEQVNLQKDSIINLLNQSLLIKDLKVLNAEATATKQASIIEAQKKRIFWRGVEIWSYRVGIAASGAMLLFSQ